MVSIRTAVQCSMDVVAPALSRAPCGARHSSPGSSWALAQSQPQAAPFPCDYFMLFRGCACCEPAPFSLWCLEQHLCSVITAPANLGRGVHSPAHPVDGSCPSGVLGTWGRVEVFVFSAASWCWARGGLGTELCLSFPQVPLKMFP